MLEKLPDAVGRALQGLRPGLDKTSYRSDGIGALPETISVTSHAFLDGETLDPRFTSDGAGVSPPLEWRGVPTEAAEVVVIVEDADSPTPQPLVHAIVHRLSGRDGGIAEGALSAAKPSVITGRNSYLKTGWLPADPPPGHGVHRYVFQVYALAAASGLAAHPGRAALIESVRKHGIARGVIVGTYRRG